MIATSFWCLCAIVLWAHNLDAGFREKAAWVMLAAGMVAFVFGV